MNKLIYLILIMVCCAFLGQVYAQQKNADSAQLKLLSGNMANAFDKAIGIQSRLYNGPAEDPYNFRSATNPNFKDTTSFINGNVTYGGVFYSNVPLIYNVNRDLLASHLTNGVSVYTFLVERVSNFDILDHHFVRLPADSLNKEVTPGFYDELYNGKIWVIARRSKVIEQESVSRGIGSVFVEKDNYYLKKGAKYYDVNSQGKFLDVLKDKKKELKQYLKDNKLRFNDNPDRAMAVLAAYYDHLTN